MVNGKMLMALGFLSLALDGGAAESLEKQVADLKEQIQYIRDNYERSEPVEIVKPVTEFVSPSGEIFMKAQKDGVSPTDGSKLEERVTYRKMKFNRREAVSDKIDSAIGAAMDGMVTVGLELSATYSNAIGAGDVVDATGVTRSANKGSAGSGVDFTLSGKPMRNTLMFVDFDAANGTPAISEAWLSFQGLRAVLSLQAGVVDLTGTFDGNRIANDETSQFSKDEFVNSPLLENPSNGPGAILRYDLSRYKFKLGAQDSLGGATDLFDSVYWIAEVETLYHFLGDVDLRLWARQKPRGDGQPDQALGISADHRLTPALTAFVRYAKSAYVEAYTAEDISNGVSESRTAVNTLDWTASGGLEIGYFNRHRLNDKLGLAYGRSDEQAGASSQFAEAYFKAQLTGNVSATLLGQGTFSRTVADAGAAALDPVSGDPKLNDAKPNEWALGIRTQFSY